MSRTKPAPHVFQADPDLPPDSRACEAVRHGDLLAYNRRGCRCPEAREAYRLYRKRLREGRAVSAFVGGTGSARRIQSLVASGHRLADLGKRFGCTGQHLGNLAHLKKSRVTRVTEARIKELFRELDGTDGGSRYARGVARRNNWADAAAWDDIDDPAEEPKVDGPPDSAEQKALSFIEGERLRLNRVERRVVVDILTGRGLTQAEVAERVGITERSVCRQRAKVRELVAS